ncbi:MAG: metallophosphoesterase [Verrucomicrobiota bacterium]
MKLTKISRRRFLLAASLAIPGAIITDARWMEPDWLKVKKLRLSDGKPTHRFVHFTDLHYKGDREYALSLVKTINSFSPDFVCFTGDLIEETRFLPEALEMISGIKSPVYAVPGNHDYWSRASFGEFAKGFAATGGAWLMDEQQVIAGGKINLLGASCRSQQQATMPLQTGAKNILLMHYPAWAKKFGEQKFDLVLAGHSHGGQVRFPFFGPIMLPFGVDEYDMGMFQTAAGPLYVNPGIGWFPVPIRFNCRPEVTVFEI